MSMMPPPTPPRPPMPNPAEQAGLRAMQQQAQIRAAVDARARMQARKRRGAPSRTSAPSTAAARVWLVIAWLLIVGAVLYIVIIR